QHYPKARCARQCREQSVEFVAEASSSSLVDCVIESFLVEHDSSPQVNIEILEWHRQQVRLVQSAQGLEGRNSRPAIVYPLEVPVYIKHAFPCLAVSSYVPLISISRA